MNKKYTYNEVKEYIESYNYQLISDIYNNCKEDLLIKCDKGHIYSASFASFKNNNSRCPECKKETLRNIYKYDINLIREEFKEKNLILISNKYDNRNTPLFYKCMKHSEIIQQTTYASFSINTFICHICSRESINSKRRLDKQDIIEKLESKNLKILNINDYKNTDSIIKFICLLHPNMIQEKVLGNMLYQNVGCAMCSLERISGKNNYNWKGGITSERDKIMASEEYKEWRKQVFKRDNYTCMKCGDNKGHNLHAHHIKNFSSNEELRFEVINGITLCDLCHNPSKYGSFHHVYGTKNNTKEQLNEFLSNYQNSITK
jgi:hypothetical protein